MRRALNTILSVFMVLVISAMMLYIPANAADTARVSIRTAVSKEGKYADSDEFSVEDTVYLILNFSGITGVGVQGFACDITYNAEALELSENTFAALADKDAKFYKYNSENRISILWDTLSKDTLFNGDVFYIVFKAKNVTADTSLPFTVTVKDFYSSETKNPDIIHNAGAASPKTHTATLVAGVIAESFLQDLLSAIEKLENITKDSLDDIVAAEMLWKDKGFTSYQKTYFMENYNSEYKLLSTARTRYNQALNQMKIDEINQLIDKFQTDYAAVLKLTTETVRPEDEALIATAQTAYEALPTSVTTRMDQNIPMLLEDLLDRIEELNDAQKAAKEYVESYNYLTSVTDVMLDEAFELYSTAIDEAVMVYDILSQDAQSLVSPLYKKIVALQEKCNAITAGDKAKATTRAEVNAFQQKWLKVFTLNSGNVTLRDKTAIEMVLADYETLSEEAKKSLASRVTMLQNLLKVIEGLEKTVDTGNSSSGNDQNNSIEKVIEKEVTVTVKEFIYKNVSKIIWGLFILLAIAIISLIFPLIMTIRYKKCMAHQKTLQTDETEGCV